MFFFYPERSRDKKSYLSRCKCPGWVQGMRSRRTWHAGTGLSRWRLEIKWRDKDVKVTVFSKACCCAEFKKTATARETRVSWKRFYWAKTKIALHVRFETPCIFQSPSEKQQPEIIYTILCLRSETLTATHLLLQIELNSALTFNAAKKRSGAVYRPARKILGRDGSSFLNRSFPRCSRRDILNYLSFNLVWYSPRRPAQHWSTGFWKHKKDREHRFNHDSPCSLSSLTPPWRNGKRHRRHVGTSSGNPYKPCNFLKALQTHKIQV